MHRTMTAARTAALTAICAIALITGCSSSSTAVGTAGSTPSAHTLSKPSRIISLSPTATEDLYAVGAGPQVVAVDGQSNYPKNAPVTKLSGITPNIEAIAGYHPSLVITDQNVNGMVAALAKLGIPVLIESAPANLDGAYSEIIQIGTTTGHGAQAQQVVTGMKQQIAAAIAQAGSAHASLTYYWELGASPFYSVTSKTFIGQVVGLFGLKNVADAADKASDGGYPQLSQEYIITAKPQLIFLSDNQPSDGGQSPSVVAGRPGWNVIPAVQHNGIIPLNDDIASRWGPRLPQLVQEIAQAVEKAK